MLNFRNKSSVRDGIRRRLEEFLNKPAGSDKCQGALAESTLEEALIRSRAEELLDRSATTDARGLSVRGRGSGESGP
jgi:hypothetical protein